MKKSRWRYLWILLSVIFLLMGCSDKDMSIASVDNKVSTVKKEMAVSTSSTVPVAQYKWLSGVPEYSDKPYAVVHDNKPFFKEEDYRKKSFETYSKLDKLGRCGVAYALVGEETMPKNSRGSIGKIKPSGWHTVRYDDVIQDKYLYNRCHLIAFELTGENANENNLITGTRYMNVEGMLPFENMVANYVKETKNHVLYRVTPIFEENNLVANGVLMEACSVEDQGKGIMFNVYCYNVQPGIRIDYSNGDSWKETEFSSSIVGTYILNIRSKKFHKPNCEWAKKISYRNKRVYTGDRYDIITWGYVPCKVCKP